jgi:DNA polymerase-3 subunit gamma/tau
LAETKGYQVSARKYRPQRFEEVSSQEFVTETLKNAIITEKIAHAYILSGPRGVGKTTIARIFAKALNCKNLQNGEPCNECDSCIEITKGTHPDVFELDAASNRGIDDVRAIQDAAKFYPIKGKKKFFIVDEVHMLTGAAFNAMLKILEEPPEYLVFILATTNPEKVPQTILSRCQRFVLKRIKIEEIIESIKAIAKEEKITVDEESLFLIAKLGDGALRDAQGIFDMAVSFCGNDIKFDELNKFLNLPDKETFFKISDYIQEGNCKDIILYFNSLIDQGFDLQTFYNGLLEHLRNLLIIISTKNIELLNESDVIRSRYMQSAEKYTEGQVLRLLKILFESEGRFKFSGNQKLLLESMLIELCRVNTEVKDLSEMIAVVNSLKKNGNLKPVKQNFRMTESVVEVDKAVKKEEAKQEKKSLADMIKEMFNAEDYEIPKQ